MTAPVDTGALRELANGCHNFRLSHICTADEFAALAHIIEALPALLAEVERRRADDQSAENNRLGWSLQIAHAVDAFNLTEPQKRALKELSDAIAENRA